VGNCIDSIDLRRSEGMTAKPFHRRHFTQPEWADGEFCPKLRFFTYSVVKYAILR
jgi:hypothetical protein